MGTSLSGINIYTKNPAQSFNFYKGLGWEVVDEGDLETDWFGAEFRFGELTIWIWNDQENKDSIRNALVLHCDDIFATYNDLKAKGYDITEPELKFYGDYEMKLKDADGNLLLFLS